jgi:hypothetical protein
MTILAIAAAMLFQEEPTVLAITPGVSESFQRAVIETVELLDAGKFTEAAEKAAALPTKKVVVKWDDTAADPASRGTLKRGLGIAKDSWEKARIGLEIVTEGTPDVLVSFTDNLGKDPVTGELRSAVHFTSFALGEPKCEAILGLKKGDPPRSSETYDAAGEAAYAIGAALGLARRPRPGSAMSRTEGMYSKPPAVSASERALVQEVIRISDLLRKAAKDHTKISIGSPEAFVDVKSLEGGTALQGGRMPMSFMVANRGDGPLLFHVVPDCSCFILGYNGVVGPGQSQLVTIDIRTLEFPGPMNKALYLYTNDPTLAMQRIPVTGNVEDAYQFQRESQLPAVMLQKDGQTETIYLTVHPDTDLKIKRADTSGLPAEVQWEPWAGVIPGQKEKKRGWKLDVHILPTSLTGRLPITVTVETDSPLFKQIYHMLNVQTGIIADPPTVNFGTTRNEPLRAFTYVSRPGTPFTVTKVEVDSKVFKARIDGKKTGDRIKVTVEYDGTGVFGSLSGVLTIHTDDPKQKVIRIPLRGMIR